MAVKVINEGEELVSNPGAKKELEDHHVGDVKHLLRNKNIEPKRRADGEVQRKCEENKAYTKKSDKKLPNKKRAQETDGTNRKDSARQEMKLAKVDELGSIFQTHSDWYGIKSNDNFSPSARTRASRRRESRACAVLP
jgi:hypothetical protein